MTKNNDVSPAKGRVINVISTKYPDILTPMQYEKKLEEEGDRVTGSNSIYNEKYYLLFIEIHHGTREAVNFLLEELYALIKD